MHQGGKTIHEGALVLVGFIWSLSVLTRLFSLFSLWSNKISSSAIFSKNNEDTLQSLPLNIRDQTLMHVYEENKRKKKTKQKKNKVRYKKSKRDNKINTIIYTRIYLPGSGAKNLTRPKDWCLLPGVSK